MIFYHGTNTIALRNILKDRFIKPVKLTYTPNLCCTTTTMQDDVVYLSTVSMIAGFYTPKRKVIIENQPVYSVILKIELPYSRNKFRPDEDYMNDILSFTNFKIYDKYINKNEYCKYVEPYLHFLKLEGIKKEDIDFRYLFLKNKKLGMKILSETDPKLSIDLGCVAYIDKIPITCIKSVCISDILETTILEITEEALDNAIKEIDFNLDRPSMDMNGILI